MAGPSVGLWFNLRKEPYGRVVVFRDLAGNKWDLLGPGPAQPGSRRDPMS